MAEVKYFKSDVGHLVSNGKVKVRFYIPIVKTEDRLEMDLLKKSPKVMEITEEEAIKAYPDVFKKSEAEDKDNAPEMTVKEMKEELVKLGVPEEEIKKAKTKDEVSALLKETQEKASK